MNERSPCITVTVNGEARTFDAGTTAQTLVEALSDPERRLALELNEEILPRSRWPEYTLQDGDRVEIVHAIGGGGAPEGPCATRNRQDSAE